MELRWLRRSGGHGYVAAGVFGVGSPEKRTARWRVVWKRLKKRMFSCGGAREVHVGAYDPQSYLQNFDEGCMMIAGEDPDVISRSFSARFAISSVFFHSRPPLTPSQL